ncbi:MAG: Rrf2 family transcriptional regulator [Hyphomicrobiaceae bacterium]|nr:Rrf2 family transcriptional regulator [Hyphomicrobiaceae bacterium]
MRLNKTTTHAIRILTTCATIETEYIKVAELSARLDLTPQNTFKLVHLLSRAGFIRAMRGRRGGVALARPAADIRVGEVVRAMETLFQEEQSTAVAEAVPGEAGLSLFDEALEAFIKVLNQNSIADLAGAHVAGSTAADGATRAGGRKPKSATSAKSGGSMAAGRASAGRANQH